MMDQQMIGQLVGRDVAERGMRYAEQNRVTQVKWDDERQVLRALVKGTEPKPYRVMVKFDGNFETGLRYNFGHCSCPVTINCKHVAAMLAETADYFDDGYRGMPETISAEQVADRRAEQPPWEAARPAPPKKDRSPAERPWKKTLDGFLSPAAGASHPLALQFDTIIRRRPAARWRSGGTKSARRLGVRPARKNDAGRWVVGGVSWRELNYYGGRANYRPEHFGWFTEFYALYKSQAAAYYPNEQHIFLDDFTNPRLWELLDEAEGIGIELIGVRANAPVTVQPAATPRFDVRRRSGLAVTPVIELAGEPIASERMGFIGDPAHGVYRFDRAGTIELAPLPTPISREFVSLVLERDELTVPPDEESDFESQYYPLLTQRIDISSSDDSYELPSVELPVLLLEATYVDSRKLELEWSWLYSGEEKPLHPRPGEVRMTEFEESVLESLPVSSAVVQEAITLTGMHAIEFSNDALDKLIDCEHVQVQIIGDRPEYRVAEENPVVRVEQKGEAEEGDWLDLTVTISVDGETVPFGALFAALSAGLKNFILPSGKYFPLGSPELAALRELIEEAAELEDQPPDGMRISKFHAGLWEEFEKLGIVEQQAVAWRETLQELAGMTSMPEPETPADLQAALRPYQADGLKWMAMLFDYGLGGVLADDMGLGKTLQTLALIAHAKAQEETRPFLVVAPTSVVAGWAGEAEKFTPDMRVEAVDRTTKKRGSPLGPLADGADIVVTSYTLFRLDFDEYAAEDWAGLILDEAQAVKNHQARLYQFARRLETRFKLAITGTPMENNLMELWSVFSIVAPGLFPAKRRFGDYYRRPIEKAGNANRLDRLRRRIRPFIMRRKKEQVAVELPEKQEQVVELDLVPAHRRIYQTHLQRERQKVLGLIDDMDKNRALIFQSLTKLRQLSLAPALVDDEHSSVEPVKIDALLEQLDDLIAEGHRALVFSQFTGLLGLIQERLDKAGIGYSYLSGSTRNRKQVIDGFKNGPTPVFLISLKAGGVGLNLTEADYCFIMDPWWNPATEEQAVDRTHRIGQTKNVMVYRFVATDTIEEKVMELKRRKSKLFAGVLDDGEYLSNALTADDVRGLFDH